MKQILHDQNDGDKARRSCNEVISNIDEDFAKLYRDAEKLGIYCIIIFLEIDTAVKIFSDKKNEYFSLYIFIVSQNIGEINEFLLNFYW